MLSMTTARKAARVRPTSNEYAPFYEKYVSLIPSEDILGTLEAQRVQMAQLFAARSEREGNFRYANGKWSVKEVLGHINDAERVFSYRAMRIGRGDTTPLPAFDQDDYVKQSGAGARTLGDLAEEFQVIRNSSIALFRSFDELAWPREGTASDVSVTVRALAFIIAGHELHHRRILEERYFSAIPRA
jgi:DinB superfamily